MEPIIQQTTVIDNKVLLPPVFNETGNEPSNILSSFNADRGVCHASYLNEGRKPFIEANTKPVSIMHLTAAWFR